jgi:hypothetical protein
MEKKQTAMTNQEKKQQNWEETISKYRHLENYCKIEARGLDDDNIYFHPIFKINGDDVYISAQCDVKHNNGIYGLKFIIMTPIYYSIEIHEGLINSIVMGYHTNKDTLMLAMTTLGNLTKHINTLHGYANEYVNHILIGNSIKETTQSIINELNVANKSIEFLQNQTKV